MMHPTLDRAIHLVAWRCDWHGRNGKRARAAIRALMTLAYAEWHKDARLHIQAVRMLDVARVVDPQRTSRCESCGRHAFEMASLWSQRYGGPISACLSCCRERARRRLDTSGM